MTKKPRMKFRTPRKKPQQQLAKKPATQHLRWVQHVSVPSKKFERNMLKPSQPFISLFICVNLSWKYPAIVIVIIRLIQAKKHQRKLPPSDGLGPKNKFRWFISSTGNKSEMFATIVIMQLG
jgi:hypothetical protein